MDILNIQKILCGLCLYLSFLPLTKQQDEGFVPEVIQNFEAKLNGQFGQQISSYRNVELAYKAYAAYFDRADVDLPGFRKYFRLLEKRSHDKSISLTTYVNKRGGRVQYPMVQMKDACGYIDTVHKSQDETAKLAPRICHFQCPHKKELPFGKKDIKKYAKGGKDGKSNQKARAADNSASDEHNYQTEDANSQPHWRSKSGQHGLEEALALEKYINLKLIDLVEHTNIHNDPHAKVVIEEFIEHQVDSIKEVADILTRLKQYRQAEDYPLGEHLLDRDLDK